MVRSSSRDASERTKVGVQDGHLPPVVVFGQWPWQEVQPPHEQTLRGLDGTRFAVRHDELRLVRSDRRRGELAERRACGLLVPLRVIEAHPVALVLRLWAGVPAVEPEEMLEVRVRGEAVGGVFEVV